MQSVNGGCRAFLIGVRARLCLCRYDGSRVYWTENCHQQIPRYCSLFFTEILHGYMVFLLRRIEFLYQLDQTSFAPFPSKFILQHDHELLSFFFFLSSTFQFDKISFHNLLIHWLSYIPFQFSSLCTQYIYPQSSSQYARSSKTNLSPGKKKISQTKKPHRFPSPQKTTLHSFYFTATNNISKY